MPFTVDDAREILGKEVKSPALLLSRLRKFGWLDRPARETYRVVHPIICAMEVKGWTWRDRIIQRDRLPILELATVRILEGFGKKLVSLMLFGSLARGRAKPESDIDILAVIEGLPESYDRRIRLIHSLISTGPIEEWRHYLWREKGIYPIVEVIALTPTEALTTHPFYLDMVEEAVTIYEKGDFMRTKLVTLREHLK